MNIISAFNLLMLSAARYIPVVASDYGDGEFSVFKALIIAIIIGLICGFIRSLILKSELTSVYKNDSATDYTRAGSFKLQGKKDIFLGTKTEVFDKPKDRDS